MKLADHIFREYDIRGIVEKDLSEDFAFLLGRAYGELASENKLNNIAVGHDCRITSPSYAQALMRGIAATGLNSFSTGMGPTPQLYYSIFANNYGGGIQVTGSHNPGNMNGFKICLGQNTLSGEQIQDIKKRMIRLSSSSSDSTTPGEINDAPIRDSYVQQIINNSKPFIGKKRLKVVVDAGNGVGGMVGPEILRGLGVEVIELFCEPDGTFPNHHPDPTEPKNLKDLISKVKKNGADLGIGWDGDADRIGVVDEKGTIIYGDMLLLIYAREILKTNPTATIIGDVKCSEYLFKDLTARGANAIMWKTGHSLIKSKLKETSGELAGEMSGHIFFKHRYFGFDDALYASARLIEILSNSETPLSQLLADLPTRFNTPEIRVDSPEHLKFKIVEKAQSAFSNYRTNTLDGVRISFDNGWGLIRASNTQPALVMRFEAETEELLNQYQKLVVDKIETIKLELT